MFTTTHDVSTGLTRIIEHTGQEKAQWEVNRAAWLAGAKDRHNEEAQRQRAAAYAAEADPLFFKAQRGEATLQQWQDKVAEIKIRFPYQE
jgi:hypothetical protein